MNEDFIKNIVPTNQTFNPIKFEGAPLTKSKLRIIFLGNSITRHEVKSSIGWNNEWGMAASSLDKDYVHQTIKLISKKVSPISYITYNCAEFERDYSNKSKIREIVSKIKPFQPDIIVIRLGENFPLERVNKKSSDLYSYLLELISLLKKICPQILVTSLFWACEIIDEAIKRVANDLNLEYVVINHLGNEDKYKAIGQFKHQGICLHPNDLGMKNIATIISKAVIKRYLK